MSQVVCFVLLSIALAVYIWLFGVVGDYLAARWRRFSLRELLAVVTVAAIVLGLVAISVSSVRVFPMR